MTARDSIHRHRARLRYAAALVALSALGACTGSGAAGTPAASSRATSSVTTTTAPSATTTSALSPTSSVDPVIAKIPADARAHTQEGAEAFARFYMEQVNLAFTKPDPTALAGLGASSCKTCSSFLTGAKDLEQKGHHHKGLSISVDGAPANSYTPEAAVIQIFVTQHSVPVVDNTGKKVDETKQGQGILIATLNFQGHWTVQRIQVAK